MKNLFLVDGASGSAKSNLVRYVEEYNIETKLVRKITDRPPKEHETSSPYYDDLEFVSSEEFEKRNPKYQYIFAGYRYGIKNAQLDEALRTASDVFLIVRNADVINKLSQDYQYINVVRVFVYSDIAKITECLKKQNVSEDQLKFVTERLDIAFRDYLRHPELYKEVLIDDGTQYLYYRLLDIVRRKHRKAPVVNDKLVFVLMSFSPENPHLADYYHAMKRAVERYDKTFKCVNLDDFAGSFKIEELAKKNMDSCRLAIVDLTENKSNVYYELGYIHAQGTDCIITAHVEAQPAFYPSIYKTVFYRNAIELEEKLYRQIAGLLGKNSFWI